MEQVDVIEKYITIVLTVFDMLNVRFCNGSGAIKEEPPLDLHQMVVWNGGAEGQPVLTTKLSKDYIYSFRGDSSLLG